MKRLLLLLLTCLPFLSPAQRVLLRQDFDQYRGYNISDWGNQYSGITPWYAGIPYTLGSLCTAIPGSKAGPNRVAAITDGGCYNDPDDSNVLLYSPSVSCTGVSGAWLRFDSYFRGARGTGYEERASIELSTDSARTWSVVQNLTANADPARFEPVYIPLASISGRPDVRIGFRYSDGHGKGRCWAIDNIELFVPLPRDLQLAELTPFDSLQRYRLVNAPFALSGTVFNNGLEPVDSFRVYYRRGKGAVRSVAFSGLGIPAFTRYAFTCPAADSLPEEGPAVYTVWTSLAGDTVRRNDTLRIGYYGVESMPVKQMVIEEGYSTGNGTCPRGQALVQRLPQDHRPALLTVHSGDPMADSAYSRYLYFLGNNFVPYYLLDRRDRIDDYDSFESTFVRAQNRFGFASIGLRTRIVKNRLVADVDVTPALELKGDFRVAVVVTEDSVHGDGPGYEQVNWYSGGKDTVGGFESLPNPVPAGQMYYNHVARVISPAPSGGKDVLPAQLLKGETYSQTIEIGLAPGWKPGRIRATAMLIRQDDSSILNARTAVSSVSVGDPEPESVYAALYPNPARDRAMVQWYAAGKGEAVLTVTDLAGRTLSREVLRAAPGATATHPLRVSALQDGIYLVTVQANGMSMTMKLQVIY